MAWEVEHTHFFGHWRNQFNNGDPIILGESNPTSLFGHELESVSGPIPSWFANLTQLTELILSFNKLQGPFPISILKLEKLETLNLRSNNLSGIVTLDMFHKLKYLTRLLLSMNNISFHTKIETNATQNKFKAIGLASCNLGNFPDFLRNQDQLEVLELS